MMILRAPHAHEGISIKKVMFKVNIALAPALLLGILQFGMPALFLVVATIISALVCEVIAMKLNPQTQGEINDGAAILTALILAMSLPPHAPLWLGALGAAFAIFFGKQVYGGLGQNLFNPAMLARVVLLISFPVEMTKWISPSAFYDGVWYKMGVDGVSGATTLGLSKEGTESSFHWLAHVLGTSTGSLGETSAILMLAGGLWLIQQQVFTWHVPVATLAGCLLPGTAMWLADPAAVPEPLAQLTSGGLLMCAFFIATDPVTTPTSNRGKLIFGAGTGFRIVVIRPCGNVPEGVAFSILIMNAFTPLIDQYTRPRMYGYDLKTEEK
ncbi:MAG: RnfABCDGE type electron transport complex subunit D [Tolumonas sp.]